MPSARVGPTHSHGFALALLAAFLLWPSPAAAVTALADLIASLETTGRYDPEKAAAVYREAVVSGTGIDRTVARLHAYSRRDVLSPEGRAACHLAIAHFKWRDGAMEDAVFASDEALEGSPTPEAMLLKARLLDAGGDDHRARDWYRRAAEAFGPGDEQWLIRVRLAMMDASSRNVAALENLAAQRSQEFRNQAAVVLALLGRPDRAIALYQPLETAGKLYQQHVRLSEWALQAESHELAREQAWLSYAVAPVRTDRLYALGLLAESYRSAGELDRLIEDLAARDSDDQDLLRLRVEALIETEKYHRAIALYGELAGTDADIAERRRLVGLFEAAGDTDAMVREYRRMMDAEPAQVQWYDGLAAHHLHVADDDAALAVWETFEARNGERGGVLVEGARLMLAMGFVGESVAMIERHVKAEGPGVGALLFLFETWLDRGDDEQALAALVRLEAFLPATAAERVELADAYERLSRPEEALRVFEAIRDVRGELGFDDQVRLAWLYTLVDCRRDALTLWRDIWVGMESPARRSLAESQMLLLAAELGALGDLAVELEEMLMSGTATRNHMNLLVRIYTEAGDAFSATEIIDEYAETLGENEVGHQQLLAHVHMLVRDYPAHDRALRRLYEIDPANRVDHIKSIIINLLTLDLAADSDERFEEIQRWLGELRQFDGGAVTGEFEAGIFSMAGFPDRAVEAYRRALVEQPENSDNLLLLAEAMADNGRADEALAILQFFAENAVHDNDFVVAVDGILNLVGTTVFSRGPDPEARGALEWTRRMILERVAGRASKFYLYELLADIARERGDTEASFVALENSLAEAGIRRPAVLRELVTMATPNTGFGGFSTGRGDIDRQLKYGRRLVGLRQHLPPDVYIDVGTALLAKGDAPGAERAFEMIDDITGMIDIDRTKAEIFETTGHDEQSRVFYNRALNVNRDSLELLHKTGFLYEAIGRDDVAFRRYLRAIRVLLARQPTVLAAGVSPMDPISRQAATERRNTTVSREYRDHFDSLEQGLLLSWPDDAGESEAAAAELKALFEAELGNVLDRAGDGLLPLARYARLDRTARLIRRVGFFLGDDDLAKHADGRLLVRFGDDEHFAQHLEKAYGAAGRVLPDGMAAAEPDATQAPRQRLPKQNDFETRLKLARLTGATDEVERLLGERIQDGRFREGLGYGLRLLEPARLNRLARAASSKLAADPDALIAFLLRDAGLFLRVEEAVGRPLLPPQEVIPLLLAPDAGARRLDGFGHNDRLGHWRYLEKRGTTDDRIRYFQVEAERSLRGERSERLGSAGAFRALLRGELTKGQRREATDGAIERLSGLRNTNHDGVRYDVHAFLPLDAHPSNSGVLYRIAQFAESRWPESPSTQPLLEAVYEGRPIEVFQRLHELGYGLPEHHLPYPGYTDRDLRVALAAPRSQLLEEIAAGRQVNPGLAAAAYEMEFPEKRFGKPSRADSERQAPLLEHLRRLDPENDLHLARLIEAWLSLGYAARAEEAIAGAYRASPDSDYWRLAYFQLLRSQQRFQEAVAVAADGRLDFRDAGVYRSELAARTANVLEPFDRVLRQLVDLGDQKPALESTTTLRWATQDLADALCAGDPEQGRRALREAWRKLLVPLKSSGYATPGNNALQLTASLLLSAPLPRNGTAEVPAQPRTLFDAVAESPYGAEELEGFLRAMPDEIRKGFHRLYGYLAQSTASGQRRKELESRLREQAIDDHEFTLWMLLRERQREAFVEGEKAALDGRLSSMADPSLFQLVLAARVFASGGAVDEAGQQYRLVAARMTRQGEYAEPEDAARGGSLDGSGIAGLLGLAREVAARLPEAVARGIVEDILSVAPRADDVPGADALFDVLVLALLDRVYGPQELLKQLGRRYPRVLAMPAQLAGAGAARAVELVRVHARAGDHGRAMEILGALLKESASRTEPYTAPSDPQYAITAALHDLKTLYGIDPLTRTNGYNVLVLAGVDAILASQERLFPTSAAQWPRISEWTGAAEQALLGWLEDGQVDQASVLELLTALGKRAVQMGEPDHAVNLLTRTITALETSGMSPGSRGAMGLASLARMTGSSLPLKVVADALKGDGLVWRDKVSLVDTFETSREIAELLKLARDHGIDHGLAMLRGLHTMAERAGDVAYASELEERIRREAAAREQLE